MLVVTVKHLYILWQLNTCQLKRPPKQSSKRQDSIMGSSQISSKRNFKKSTGAKTKFLKDVWSANKVLINSLII